LADLLASLLKQLVQARPIPEIIKSLYESHKSRRNYPSNDEISKALHSICTNYSKVFIVVDALDEYQVSNRRILLSEIFNLQAKSRISFFATSRFIPEITKEFEGSISLEVRANDDDIRRYLDGRISRLRPFVKNNPTLRDETKAEIIKAVDGMYVPSYLAKGLY
jgi:hypothetical protein